MASELNHHVGYSRENECWFVRFYPYQTEQQAKDAAAAFTRPAPAATNTGLVTVDTQMRYRTIGKEIGDWSDWRDSVSPPLDPVRYDVETRELVTRSQAEELLAAERAEKEELRRAIMGKEPAPDLQHGNFLEMAATLHRACDGARKRAEYAEQRLGQSEAELKQVRADNAAQAARIKAETELREDHQQRNKELEAKLGAAEKALKAARPYVEHYDTRAPNSLQDEALTQIDAVLGGKPS